MDERRPPSRGGKDRNDKSRTDLPVHEAQSDWDEPFEDDVDSRVEATRSNPGDEEGERGARPMRSKAAQDTEGYSVVAHFDPSRSTYIAESLEFPQLRATHSERERACALLEERLAQHIRQCKERREELPEPFGTKKYAEMVEVHLSQALHRKLDRLAQLQQLTLDQLLLELIMTGLEKSSGEPRGRGQGPQGGRHDRGHRAGGGGGGHQGGSRGRNRRGYNEALETGENFREYVRNLEKGKWRKGR